MGAVEEKLLESHLPGVLEKGFDALMSERSIPDLARLYSLAGRIHAVDSIKLAFKEYIKKTGFVIVMDEEKVRQEDKGWGARARRGALVRNVEKEPNDGGWNLGCSVLGGGGPLARCLYCDMNTACTVV